MLKRQLQHVICFFLIASFIALIPFFPTASPPLNLEEQLKLKEGKTFWQWQSVYGNHAVHYVEKGTGSNHVILLHGFRANTFTWRYLIDPLAEAGYHVWVIDLIGYGFSDKPSSVPYTVNFFLEQINAFMEGQQIEHAHLIGNSMGGGLSLGMALNYSHRVSSLSLIDALGYPLDLSFYLIIGKNFGYFLSPLVGPAIIRQGMQDIIHNKELITEEQIEAYALPYRLPGGTDAANATLEKFDNQILLRLSSLYSTIQQPVLVIWGECDNLIPISHYHRFIKDFPNCSHHLIKNCGHIPQEESPQDVIASILAFLKAQNS